jgi:thiamine-phosphate pyrophosphorylase
MKSITLRKKLLCSAKLYFVLDIDTVLKPPLYIVKKLLKDRCVDIIQLRDKTDPKKKIYKLAVAIKKILDKSDILFIINDYIDIAESIGADGLHIGQNDLPLPLVKRLLGKDKIVGVSCHSLEEAKEAEKEKADYISIGPVFFSPLKPDYKAIGINTLKLLKDRVSIPYFAIGGIDLSNMDKLISMKIDRFAFSRLIGRRKNISQAIMQLKERFYKNDPERICA